MGQQMAVRIPRAVFLRGARTLQVVWFLDQKHGDREGRKGWTCLRTVRVAGLD